MSRRALALASAALLLAGCAGAPAESARPPGERALLGLHGPPRVLTTGGAPVVAWTFDVQSNGTSGSARVELAVKLYNRTEAGSDRAEVQLAQGGRAQVTLRTPYVGWGDYAWTLTASDARGAAGSARGLWESCPC